MVWDTYKTIINYKFFPGLLVDPTIPNEDKEKIKNLLLKPFNPYVRRHSALTEEYETKIAYSKSTRWLDYL
jgi:hypothetical protein